MCAQNAANFSAGNLNLVNFNQLFKAEFSSAIKMNPVLWNFILCDKNVAVYATCVNNVANPKLNA